MKTFLRLILLYILIGLVIQLIFGSQYAILPQSFLLFNIALLQNDFLLLLFLAIIVGVLWNGGVKMFYKYNTLIVIAYIVFLSPIAFIHLMLLGLFGDNKKEMIKKKAKEQAEFETLVEEEKNK